MMLQRQIRVLATMMACAAASIASPSIAQDIPADELVDLGTPQDEAFGAGRGTGIQVSADGSTVLGYIQPQSGSTATTDGTVRLVFWRNGILTDITPDGALLTPALLSHVNSPPYLMSDDGLTIVAVFVPKAGGTTNTLVRFRDGRADNITIENPATLFLRAISNDGATLVGYADDHSAGSNAALSAFRYDADGWRLLDNPADHSAAAAYSVSGDGTVSVGAAFTGVAAHAVRWVGTDPQLLGNLAGYASTVATFANQDGSVIAGLARRDETLSQSLRSGDAGFVWRAGVMSDLGRLGEGKGQLSIVGISADGSTIIGQSPHTNPGVFASPQGFYWRDGTMHEIGYLPTDVASGQYTIARAVSGDGSVIVGGQRAAVSIAGNFNLIAFRWQDGEVTSLGTLGGHSSYAIDVSTDGTTIVGWAENAAFERRPFIYRTQMQDFTNLIGSFARQADEAEIVAEQQHFLTRQLGAQACSPGEAGFCVAARGFGLQSAADQGTGIGHRSAGALSLHGAVRLFDGLVIGAGWGAADTGVRDDRQDGRLQRIWSVSADIGTAFRWASGFGGRVWFARSTDQLELTRGEGFDNVEPLTGTARQTGKAYGAEARLGFEAFGDTLLAARIAIARATTSRRAYAESGGDYPASYNALSIDRTIAEAALGAAHPLRKGTLWFELGGETDLESNPVVISGASEIPAMERFALPSALDRHKLRGTMNAGYAVPLGPLNLGLEVTAVTPVYGGRWQTGVSITLRAAL